MLLLLFAVLFQNQHFLKFLSRMLSSDKQLGSRSGPTVSVLIWVQTVCKCYRRRQKLPPARKELSEMCGVLSPEAQFIIERKWMYAYYSFEPCQEKNPHVCLEPIPLNPTLMFDITNVQHAPL